MKSKYLIIVLIVAALAVILFYSRSARQSPENYEAEIKQKRAKTDLFMKESPDSPFRQIATAYTGLRFFAPDRRYRVKASIEPIENKKLVLIETSDGKENEYLEYGWAKFQLKGHENKLLILEVTEAGPGHGTLFLAFADSTSARETYGAGRYLEIKKVPGMTEAEIDFNLAYNPYCAYSDQFSCPLPPKENLMDVAVMAGEKAYH